MLLRWPWLAAVSHSQPAWGGTHAIMLQCGAGPLQKHQHPAHGSPSLYTPSPTAYLVTWMWLQLPFLSVVLGQPSPPLWVTAEFLVGRTQAADSAHEHSRIPLCRRVGTRDLTSPKLVLAFRT